MFGELCVRCKGRLWCGLPKCPILEAAKDYLPRIRISGDSLFGLSPPSVFVGRIGHPNVYAGPLVSRDENATILSDTSSLYGRDLDFILRSTSSLLRTSAKVNVRKVRGRIVDATQEIAMSLKPLDTEVKVEKVSTTPSLDTFFHPTGPRIIPKRIDVVDNPDIPRKVDSIAEERIKANEAIEELYRYGMSVDYLQRLLAAGILGKDRKLVPTRWSITAVDDAIAKSLLKDIRHYNTIGQVEYYSSSFMGNEFHVLLLPGVWEYEMIETWIRGSVYASSTFTGEDYEPYEGRKDYASNITGAYYAARLAVVEHLAARRRQARVIVYREITPEYQLPLGVWVIRETVRHALRKKPVSFDTMDGAIQEILRRTRMKGWVKKSRIVYGVKHQKTLDAFL